LEFRLQADERVKSSGPRKRGTPNKKDIHAGAPASGTAVFDWMFNVE